MPAGRTYEPIATTAPTTSPTEITFSNIPGTYTDLILVMTSNVSSTDSVYVRPNSDGSALYSATWITGNGSSASTSRQTGESRGMLTDFNGSPTNDNNNITIFQLFNYANTTTNKTAISRSNRAGSGTDAVVSLWRSTAAVTSLNIRISTGVKTFATGTVMTLYGITAA